LLLAQAGATPIVPAANSRAAARAWKRAITDIHFWLKIVSSE
jgi:hypothetical protein